MADLPVSSDADLECEDIVSNKKLGLGSALDHFKEYEEVKKIITELTLHSTGVIKHERLFERYRYLLVMYQEQPHLLDPHLQEMLDMLLVAVRQAKSQQNVDLQHSSFKLITILSNVRGRKVLVRHMPHEVGDLQLVLNLISDQNPNDIDTWETRFALLMWLSILVMIPFHMDRLDADHTGISTMDRIVRIIQDYLCCNDSTSQSAVMLAGKFFSRPDAKTSHLPYFIDWALQYLSQEDVVSNVSHKNTILKALAQLFKHGKREDMEEHARHVFRKLIDLNTLDSQSDLMRRNTIKVIQRIGLTFLHARVASWRYNRGCRSLMANLAVSTTSQTTPTASLTTQEMDTEEEYEVPEVIEEIFELLLRGLRDGWTNIRWSAAKGIGRVCGRLPKELADDVIGSVIDLFDMKEGDKAWHGACLALAELGRRGLLVPEHLERVIPVVLKALVYDELKGNFSVGSHIRDAACYVFWAFSRAYDSDVLKPYVQKIAEGLLINAVFDREINCRKAAASAFQENVGRQGTFPHGIDIMTAVNFFTVAFKQHAYLHLSVYVAQFPEYTLALINHLIEFKLIHWDTEVRELASQTLHKLTPLDPGYMTSSALPRLLKMAQGIDMYSRHGAVLALCEVIEGLNELNTDKSLDSILGKEELDQIRNIAFHLHEKKVFRGLGGDLMRSAICIFINKMSKCSLLHENDWNAIELWKKILCECLTNVDGNLRSSATEAFSQICQDYYVQDKGRSSKLLQECLEGLNSYQEPTVCGYASALGSFPILFLGDEFHEVLDKLLFCTIISKEEQKLWVQARSTSISSLVKIGQSLGAEGLPQEVANLLFKTFISSMGDYTTDSRGDIGNFVRIAAINALKDLTLMFVQSGCTSLLSPELVKEMFCAILKVAVEKMDKVSSAAGQFIVALLYSCPEVPHIPHREKLLSLLPPSLCEGILWSKCVETFPILVQLLLEPSYAYHLLLGFTVTIGCDIEYFVKCTRTCLLTFLTPIKSNDERRFLLEKTFLQLLRDHARNKRTVICVMKMADFLLSSGIFDDTDPDNFPLELYKIGWEATRLQKDIRRILAMIDVLCDLISFSGKSRTSALSSLSIWLCHKYPHVRAVTAQKLYESLVASSDVIPDESLEDLLTVLSETNWSAETVEVLRPVRNQICKYMEIAPPVMK